MDKYDKAWLHIEQYLEHGGADPAAILRESFPDPTEDSLTEERALAGDWARHDIGEIVNALEHAIDAYDALRAQLAEEQSDTVITKPKSTHLLATAPDATALREVDVPPCPKCGKPARSSTWIMYGCGDGNCDESIQPWTLPAWREHCALLRSEPRGEEPR
jgi:hypothetical protein